MPRRRDREGTKAAILEAAEELFAARGFAGTSLSQVAAKSGTSGPLVVFHFKDKRGLYQAVKAAIVERHVDYGAGLPHEGPFVEGLEALVRSMFAFYRDNPTMMRLANWGRLEGDLEPWPGEEQWHHLYVDRLRAAQRRGELRDDIAPYRALVLISGTLHVWWEYREHLLRDLEAFGEAEGADEAYLEEVLRVLKGGLLPAAELDTVVRS